MKTEAQTDLDRHLDQRPHMPLCLCKRENLVKRINVHVGLRIVRVHPKGFGFKHHWGHCRVSLSKAQ